MQGLSTLLIDMYGVILEESKENFIPYTFEHYGPEKYFKDKIVSGDVKCRKPDEKIYDLALERSGKGSSECIFVDNSVKNLDVAEELGIVPILFNRDSVSYAGETVNNFYELSERLM